MKLLLCMFILLSSFGAFAANGWVCVGQTEGDTSKLERLKLGKQLYLPEIQVLTVNEKYCRLPHIMIYAGVCQFKGHTLSIGLDSASEIVTKKGTIISLICEADEDVGPVGASAESN